jgi:hypothetical protein
MDLILNFLANGGKGFGKFLSESGGFVKRFGDGIREFVLENFQMKLVFMNLELKKCDHFVELGKFLAEIEA